VLFIADYFRSSYILNGPIYKRSVEDFDLLGYNSVESQLKFRRNISPPSSGSKDKSSKKPIVLSTCFMLETCLAHSSNLKVETIYSYETSIDFQRNTLRYIPEERIVCSHRCENLKSYKTVSFVSLSQQQVKITTRHFRREIGKSYENHRLDQYSNLIYHENQVAKLQAIQYPNKMFRIMRRQHLD
jgi:hypothetical protein